MLINHEQSNLEHMPCHESQGDFSHVVVPSKGGDIMDWVDKVVEFIARILEAAPPPDKPKPKF